MRALPCSRRPKPAPHPQGALDISPPYLSLSLACAADCRPRREPLLLARLEPLRLWAGGPRRARHGDAPHRLRAAAARAAAALAPPVPRRA
eukprot:395025-Prymnesium_polylepis.1